MLQSELVINNEFTSILKTCDNIYDVENNVIDKTENPVKFSPLCRTRSVRSSDFFSRLTSRFHTSNEIMPNGCKYFKILPNGFKTIIIEEQPRIRTIKAKINIDQIIEKLKMTGKLKEYGYENFADEHFEERVNGVPYSFQLSFPYVVFIITLNHNNELRELKPFFRIHPITSLRDYLFKAPLYNIPDSQKMCLGSTHTFPSVLETVESIIEAFWFNVYNNDYSNNVRSYNDSEAFEVQDYLTWMYYSKKNPMFIYNVKWIKYYDINHVLNSVNQNYNYTVNMLELFSSAISETTSDSVATTPRSVNITYSTCVGRNGDPIAVGDELSFNNKKMYLYSIISKDYGDSLDSVELEDEEGKVIEVPFREFERGYKTIYQPKLIKEITVSGKVIKPESIITFKMGDLNVFKQIKSIRIAQDGKIEVLIGSDHYLIENIDFNVIDLSNILIQGKPLEKDKYYSTISLDGSYRSWFAIKKICFEKISIGGGRVSLQFRIDGYNRGVTMSLDKLNNMEEGEKFIDEKSIELHEVVCHYDRLLTSTINNLPKIQLIKNKGILIDDSRRFSDYLYNLNSNNIKAILDKIILENGTRLFIPGSIIDVNFKIGEPIIYSNWDNPEDMLTVSTIDKFDYNSLDNILYICSTSLNKKTEFKIPFIYFKDNVVNVGIVRKISSKCGAWKSGDKIKANVAGIPNFPKKDVNTIIGFIGDGGTKYPLALCSNLCTLWMNEETISKFDLHLLKSVKWLKMENSPIDINKIKWQYGDFYKRVNSTNVRFLVKKSASMTSFYNYYLSQWGDFDGGYTISKSDLNYGHIRHGILMPRLSLTNTRLRSKKCIPNYLGGYILEEDISIYNSSEQFVEDF